MISSDANLGDVSGGLAFAGGTLAVTDTIVSARALSLATDGGTVSVASGKSYTLLNAVNNQAAATGTLTKSGDGTLVLAATNSYSGGTNILGGTLQLGNGTAGHDGSILSDIDNNASLVVANLGATVFQSHISGTGSLTQSGTGVLTLSGYNDYSGGTYLLAGTVSVAQEQNLG
ncbi:autotransporter-associated beta strand repeat-containing protein, partial [Cellulomonas iranensis]|uniref:autotransporter-associated beta strand repeat-containing protein n=1 Tax=Cellulomonas iranensis TaxID=76862 RepID=UPI00277D097A